MTKEKEYDSKVLFLRKSKAGKHLYAFNRDEILGVGVKSILINVEDMHQLLGGGDWCKVSAMMDSGEEKEENDS